MSNIDEQLATIANSSQKDQSAAYTDVLKQLVTSPSPSPSEIKKVSFAVANDNNVAIVVGRQVIAELVKLIEGDVLDKDKEVKKQIIQDTLESIQPRIITYEEQVSINVSITIRVFNHPYGRLYLCGLCWQIC